MIRLGTLVCFTMIQILYHLQQILVCLTLQMFGITDDKNKDLQHGSDKLNQKLAMHHQIFGENNMLKVSHDEFSDMSFLKTNNINNQQRMVGTGYQGYQQGPLAGTPSPVQQESSTCLIGKYDYYDPSFDNPHMLSEEEQKCMHDPKHIHDVNYFPRSFDSV